MTRTISFAVAAAVSVAGLAGLGGCADAPTSHSLEKRNREAISLSCYSSTDSTITLQVKAGTLGAPEGFTVHWMTRRDYRANRPWDSAFNASFEVALDDSLFSLAPDETALVTLGIAQPDSVATGDSAALLCGTSYVFRSSAINPQTGPLYNDAITCETSDCDDTTAVLCTFGMGYWKNHADAWTLDSLTIGNHTYTKDQLMSILWSPPRGNHLIIFARKLIVAQLNRAHIDDTTGVVTEAIDSANAIIGDVMIPPVGDGSMRWTPEMQDVAATLDRYNEGEYTGGACDEAEDDDEGEADRDDDEDDAALIGEVGA